MRFRIERSFSRDGYNVWLIEHKGSGGYIAKPVNLEMEKIDDGALLPEPTLFIPSLEMPKVLSALKEGIGEFEFGRAKEVPVQKEFLEHLQKENAWLRSRLEQASIIHIPFKE